MQDNDLTALLVLWEDEQLKYLAGDGDPLAGDSAAGGPVGSTSDHWRRAVPSTANKEMALAWTASRVCWEYRLDALRSTPAAEVGASSANASE
jgi:hypothetical protein